MIQVLKVAKWSFDLRPNFEKNPFRSPVELGWAACSAGGRHRRYSLRSGLHRGRSGVGVWRHGSQRVAPPSIQVNSQLTGSWSQSPRPVCRSFFSRGGHECKSGFLEAGTFFMHQSGPRCFPCGVTPRAALFAHRDEISKICSSKGAARCRCPASDPCNPSPQVSWMCGMLDNGVRPVKRGAGVKPAGAGVAVSGQRGRRREGAPCLQQGRPWLVLYHLMRASCACMRLVCGVFVRTTGFLFPG